jgi:hypothetical protein
MKYFFCEFISAAWLMPVVTVFALTLAGCGVLGPSVQRNSTANTTASYKVVNGNPEVFYSSNKDQQGFSAKVVLDDAGRPKEFTVATSANTPEAAIAAAAEAQAKAMDSLTQVLNAVLPLVAAAVQGGAAGGAPGAAAAAGAKLLQEKANAGAAAPAARP